MIGHSQGGTLLLMLLARHPDFGAHVDAVITLAPCVHIKYMQSPVLEPWCRLANVSDDTQCTNVWLASKAVTGCYACMCAQQLHICRAICWSHCAG